jgi:hypothetical protein
MTPEETDLVERATALVDAISKPLFIFRFARGLHGSLAVNPATTSAATDSKRRGAERRMVNAAREIIAIVEGEV